MISLRGSPLTSRVKVQPDSGSEDFGPGQKPFGQGSGFYNYTGNCTIPTLVPGGQKTGTCHQWGQINANRCPLEPRGDLLAQRNPTCDIRTYTGGLAVCLHGWHLLDADQPIPWTDRPLVYYKKYRVYFQEYEPTKHKQIQRHDWGIGSGNGAKTPELANGGAEYDVPQCAANSGGVTTTCNHTIQVSPLSCPSPCPHLRAYLADSPRLPPYFSRARRDGSTEPQAGTQAKKQWQEDQDPRTRPFVRHRRCSSGKDHLGPLHAGPDREGDRGRRRGHPVQAALRAQLGGHLRGLARGGRPALILAVGRLALPRRRLPLGPTRAPAVRKHALAGGARRFVAGLRVLPAAQHGGAAVVEGGGDPHLQHQQTAHDRRRPHGRVG